MSGDPASKDKADTLATVEPRSLSSSMLNSGAEVRARKTFRCKLCAYIVERVDRTDHENDFLHKTNLSLTQDGFPIIGKAWHCNFCGRSMFRGRVDFHIASAIHNQNFEHGNSLEINVWILG